MKLEHPVMTYALTFLSSVLDEDVKERFKATQDPLYYYLLATANRLAGYLHEEEQRRAMNILYKAVLGNTLSDLFVLSVRSSLRRSFNS